MDEHGEQPSASIQATEQGEDDRADTFSTPAADVFETASEIVILMDIPGVDEDHLDIDLRSGSLTVTGRRKELEDRGTAILAEYQRCSYFRYFRVPQNVDEGRITASLADGVLRVVLPKASRGQRRKISLMSE